MIGPERTNPEELAAYKVVVSVDALYRWAEALAGASGTISGAAKAFKAVGKHIDMFDEEEAHLDEVREEIVAKMKEGVRI